MAKKWITTLVFILLAGTIIYLIYENYTKVSQNRVVEQQVSQEEKKGQDRSAPPNVSPEKQVIIKAVIAKMTAVMESKNAKKIREFTLSLYQDQSEKDAINQTTDSQMLKSAQFYKDLSLGAAISTALAYLPDSAWNISSSTATVTQETEGGHKIIFTATKVNGVWQ